VDITGTAESWVEELRKIKEFSFSQNAPWPMAARSVKVCSVKVLTSLAIKNEIAEAALIGFRY
jgi:hypothetical protein